MKEQTGDLREAKFKEINNKLNHLKELDINELKYLYNELCGYKRDYLKYMSKLEIEKDTTTKILLLIVLILDIFLLFWMILQRNPFILKLVELIIIVLSSNYCYEKILINPQEKVIDKYNSNLKTISDLIIEKDRNKDKSLNEEIQKESLDLSRSRDDIVLVHEQALTLKRELTKDTKRI